MIWYLYIQNLEKIIAKSVSILYLFNIIPLFQIELSKNTLHYVEKKPWISRYISPLLHWRTSNLVVRIQKRFRTETALEVEVNDHAALEIVLLTWEFWITKPCWLKWWLDEFRMNCRFSKNQRRRRSFILEGFGDFQQILSHQIFFTLNVKSVKQIKFLSSSYTM